MHMSKLVLEILCANASDRKVVHEQVVSLLEGNSLSNILITLTFRQSKCTYIILSQLNSVNDTGYMAGKLSTYIYLPLHLQGFIRGFFR
jgi:hypothetical protein